MVYVRTACYHRRKISNRSIQYSFGSTSWSIYVVERIQSIDMSTRTHVQPKRRPYLRHGVILLAKFMLALVLLSADGTKVSHALSSSTSAGSTSTAAAARPYCVNLKCRVKADRRQDFIALIQTNQRLTLQDEPEALQYIVGEDCAVRDTFYIHEQFTSKAGFALHRDTEHSAKWREFTQTAPFLEGPTTNFYDGTHTGVARPPPIEQAYCLHVQLSVDPSHREEFLRVIEENARGSNQDEPLCLQYVWGEDCEQRNLFHFHEQYTGDNGGEEGFRAHQASPHFQGWLQFESKNPFTKPPLVDFYRTL